jgi:Ca2+-binding RTX toxin-like protein
VGNRYAIVPYAQLGSDGIAHVFGKNSADSVEVTSISGKIHFLVNVETTDFNLSDVNGVQMDLYGGDDIARAAANLATTINGGIGNDSIATAGGNDSITSGIGSDTISSGDGDDTIKLGESFSDIGDDIHRVDDQRMEPPRRREPHAGGNL